MKKSILYFLPALFGCAFLGCGSNDFYYDCYDGALARVPLIEPYEVTSTNEGRSWFFFLTSEKHLQVTNVDSVGINDSIFVVYSNKYFNSDVGTSDLPTWIITDARSDKKHMYQDYAKYIALLDSLKVRNLKLYEINSVFKNFLKTYKWPKEWPKKENK